MNDKHPLDLLAHKALASLNQEIDDQVPASLQLAQWVLRERPKAIPYPASAVTTELDEAASQISDWAPKILHNLLDNHESSLATELKEASPLTLAVRLVENLHDNLQVQMPQLRTPETPPT